MKATFKRLIKEFYELEKQNAEKSNLFNKINESFNKYGYVKFYLIKPLFLKFLSNNAKYAKKYYNNNELIIFNNLDYHQIETIFAKTYNELIFSDKMQALAKTNNALVLFL